MAAITKRAASRKVSLGGCGSGNSNGCNPSLTNFHQ
jgi:hypothetical protein